MLVDYQAACTSEPFVPPFCSSAGFTLSLRSLSLFKVLTQLNFLRYSSQTTSPVFVLWLLILVFWTWFWAVVHVAAGDVPTSQSIYLLHECTARSPLSSNNHWLNCTALLCSFPGFIYSVSLSLLEISSTHCAHHIFHCTCSLIQQKLVMLT